MRNAFKIIPLILCVALLFSACGNNTPQDETTTQAPQADVNLTDSVPIGDGKIALPYNETDGFNPFFAKSYENLFICQMLFDSLFTLDENYNAIPEIAEGVTVNGKTATVRLGDNAVCRGSQPINAYDVVYSFNLAKASYGWAGYLNGISEATAQSKYVVNFSLTFEDIYVGGKLCFPVVKEGTADIPTAVPTGSGDYYYLEESLINVADSSKKIQLRSIDTNKSAENAFKIGDTDVYFNDLSSSEYVGISGNTQEALLNNMVYMGFNSNNGGLNKYVRSAVAAKINGEDVVLSAYQGHGEAVKIPANPNVADYEKLSAVKVQGDTTLAKQILDRAGFIRYSGKAKTNGAYTLSFSLIVNRDNKYRLAAAYSIADSLNEIGFYIQVKPLSFEDYNQRISAGNYDMYLGEVKLDGSMDLSQFFDEASVLSNGIDKTSKAVTQYYKYRAGKITAKEYYSAFTEDYPFVPVLFRNGYVVTSADIKADLSKTPMELYGNL